MLGHMTALDVISQHFGFPSPTVQAFSSYFSSSGYSFPAWEQPSHPTLSPKGKTDFRIRVARPPCQRQRVSAEPRCCPRSWFLWRHWSCPRPTSRNMLHKTQRGEASNGGTHRQTGGGSRSWHGRIDGGPRAR